MKLAASLLAFGAVVLLAACGSSPTISSFTADKSAVNLGESVNLSWTVDGAESLTLNGGAVSGTSTTVSPKKTTVYSLTATNGHGSVSSSPVTVTVTVQNVVKDDWTLYGPDHYSGNTLTVDVPNLGLDEHLAIIAMNLGDQDVDPAVPVPNATLTVTGTNPVFSARPAPPPAVQSSARMAVGNGPVMEDLEGELARRDGALRAHGVIRAKETQVLADAARRQKAGLKVGPATQAPLLRNGLAAAAPTNTDFCIQQGSSPGALYTRKTATLKKETAHALFYLDDDDAADYAPYETGLPGDIWTTLGDLWENTIYPADTQTFGAESDLDGNGKLIIFFSREAGAPVGGSIVLGYYWAGDVIYPKDTTSDCSVNGSNGADMFYMNTFHNLQQAHYADTDVIADNYPDTLGHEFQHLINFNQKHLVPNDFSTAEDTWINEGLSVTAEDIIGFGWNGPGGRSDANAYLTDLTYDLSNPDTNPNYNPFVRYFNASFSNWSGDPVGNYQGAHAFFRYFTDRMGEGILKNIVQTTQVGTDNLARVLGEPYDQAFAEWTTALLFSNESNEPSTKFDFTGASWSPLHAKLTASAGCGSAFPYPNRAGYLQYETFDNGTAKAALRSLGFNVFVTNAGLNQPVSLTVTPTQSGVQPEVAVIRFTGSLPDGRQLSCN